METEFLHGFAPQTERVADGNGRDEWHQTARSRSEDALRASPMMGQYLEIKAANPGSLLFYRMGDFYELFFEDAEIAARVLGITLTKRGKHLGHDIPMCGVPVHASDQYLERLIRSGHRVAVCEQIEDPLEARRRGSKAIVRREIVRLVTPGTLTEEGLLEGRKSNYLLALCRSGRDDSLALAWIDISTGEFSVAQPPPALLPVELARLEPSEIIVPENLFAEAASAQMLQGIRRGGNAFAGCRASTAGNGELRLKKQYAVDALDGLGSFTRSELGAAGALLDYVSLTQVGKLPPLAIFAAQRSRATSCSSMPERAIISSLCARFPVNAAAAFWKRSTRR